MPTCRRCLTETEWWDMRKGVCDDCRTEASHRALKKFLKDKEKAAQAKQEQAGRFQPRL